MHDIDSFAPRFYAEVQSAGECTGDTSLRHTGQGMEAQLTFLASGPRRTVASAPFATFDDDGDLHGIEIISHRIATCFEVGR